MTRHQEIFIQALNIVHFAERYKNVTSAHNELDFNKLEKKTDQKKIVNAIESFGYSVKKFPGGSYDIREEMGDFTTQLHINVKGGMMTNYLGVFFNGQMINDMNKQYNFAFIYRYLVNNSNADITAPKFTSYIEFTQIVKDILSIYEDFKIAFIESLDR